MMLPGLSSEDEAFAAELNDLMAACGYKAKNAEKDGAARVTYVHVKTKRALVRISVSGGKMDVHIYADHVNKYLADLTPLPDEMTDSMKKGRMCEGLAYPGACNTKCIKGYDVIIDGTRYQKCRYMNFKFTVNAVTRDAIMKFIDLEAKCRE